MGADNKYAGDQAPDEDSGLAPENKYAGENTAADPGLAPENKYAGDKPGGREPEPKKDNK